MFTLPKYNINDTTLATLLACAIRNDVNLVTGLKITKLGKDLVIAWDLYSFLKDH